LVIKMLIGCDGRSIRWGGHMKILALSLFTLLFVLVMGSHWRSEHPESQQLNSQVRPGARTVSDIRSGLEMVMPILDRQSYLDTEEIAFVKSRSSSSVRDNAGKDGETDLDEGVIEHVAGCDQDVQDTNSMLRGLQKEPLKFNGLAGYELTLLLHNVRMCNVAMVLDLKQAESQGWLDPKRPEDSVRVIQLIRELNNNGVDILRAKQVEELWFMQYVESASGELAEGSEAASSKTKKSIQRVLEGSRTLRP
jgi:hypothetical protein